MIRAEASRRLEVEWGGVVGYRGVFSSFRLFVFLWYLLEWNGMDGFTLGLSSGWRWSGILDFLGLTLDIHENIEDIEPRNVKI